MREGLRVGFGNSHALGVAILRFLADSGVVPVGSLSVILKRQAKAEVLLLPAQRGSIDFGAIELT